MIFFESLDFWQAIAMFLAGFASFIPLLWAWRALRDIRRPRKPSIRPRYVHELPEWETIFQDRR